MSPLRLMLNVRRHFGAFERVTGTAISLGENATLCSKLPNLRADVLVVSHQRADGTYARHDQTDDAIRKSVLQVALEFLLRSDDFTSFAHLFPGFSGDSSRAAAEVVDADALSSLEERTTLPYFGVVQVPNGVDSSTSRVFEAASASPGSVVTLPGSRDTSA